MSSETRRKSKAGRGARMAVAGLVGETVLTWIRAGRPGGNLVVRCADGHLFTTLWIPGASVKAVRLGWWRIQRCPVGGHWSVVTPVRQDELSPLQRFAAHRRRDVRVP
jgi:hypothetical protein